MLALRNRRFRTAAVLAALAGVCAFGYLLCETISLYRWPGPAGAGFSRGIGTFAALVAIPGWILVARSLGERVDRKALRRGAKVLAWSFCLSLAAAALDLYINLANPGYTRYRISVALDAVSYLFVAATAVIVWRSLAAERSGADLGQGMRRGAAALAFAYLAATGTVIFEQSYYSSYKVPGTMTAGTTLQAAGSLVLAVAAAIAAIAFGRRLGRREEGLALAGGVAAVAFLFVVLGDVLFNAHLGLFHYPAPEVTGGWIEVGYRALTAASFAVAAGGAYAAASSPLGRGGAA
jgi:hypothetical protein